MEGLEKDINDCLEAMKAFAHRANVKMCPKCDGIGNRAFYGTEWEDAVNECDNCEGTGIV